MDERLAFDNDIPVSESDHILVARLNENDEPISGGYYSVKDLQDFLIQIQLIDNLTSDSTLGSLTANQGRILKGLIDSLTITVGSNSTAISTNSTNINKKLDSTDLTKENVVGLKLTDSPTFDNVYSNNLFGQGQSWQNVKGSRALNTTYYNTTSRPIQLSVGLYASQEEIGFVIEINGHEVGRLKNYNYAGGGTFNNIIMPGNSYMIRSYPNSYTVIQQWYELR